MPVDSVEYFNVVSLSFAEKVVLDETIERLIKTPEGNFLFSFLKNEAVTGEKYNITFNSGSGNIYNQQTKTLNIDINAIINGRYIDPNGVQVQQTLDDVLFHEALHIIDVEYIFHGSYYQLTNNPNANPPSPHDYYDHFVSSTIITATNIIREDFGKLDRVENYQIFVSTLQPGQQGYVAPDIALFASYTNLSGISYIFPDNPIQGSSSDPIDSFFLESFILPLRDANVVNSNIITSAGNLTYINFLIAEFIISFELGDTLRPNPDADADIISGTNSNDFINNNSPDPQSTTETGNDLIFAWGGDDHIVGTRGNDIILGGTGFDTLDYSQISAGAKGSE